MGVDSGLRNVEEKVSLSSQEIVKRDTLKVYDVKAPESIFELGTLSRRLDPFVRESVEFSHSCRSKLIDPCYNIYYKCSGTLQKEIKIFAHV